MKNNKQSKLNIIYYAKDSAKHKEYNNSSSDSHSHQDNAILTTENDTNILTNSNIQNNSLRESYNNNPSIIIVDNPSIISPIQEGIGGLNLTEQQIR